MRNARPPPRGASKAAVERRHAQALHWLSAWKVKERTLILQRYLDDREARGQNVAPVMAVECEGDVDERALARAFELLTVRYPVLRARVRKDGTGYLLYATEDHRPSLEVLEGDAHTARQVSERPWDLSNGVAQLMLIRSDGTRQFVAMRMDHAVVNGPSWMSMFTDLWRLYTAIVNGDDISVDPGTSLPRPPTELIEQHWEIGKHASPNAPDDRRSITIRSYKVLQSQIHFDWEETTRLISAARTSKISVHALICGALLVSQRDHVGSTREPAPMACFSAVSLHKRISRPIDATESTNFHRVHMAVTTVPAQGDPVEVGREIKTQLDAAIANHDLASTRPSQPETSIEERLASISVSNMGVLPTFAQPAALTITDWVRYLDVTTVCYPSHGIYTFDGRLKILSAYPVDFFTSDEVEQLAARIKLLLTRY